MADGAQPGTPAGRTPLATALLPGTPFLLQRRWWAGLVSLGAFALLAGVAVSSADRIADTFRGPARVDEWVALVTLVLALIALWTINARATARPGGFVPGRPGSLLREVWIEFRRNRLAVAGVFALALLTLVTLLAPYLAPFDPKAIGDIVATRHLHPSLAHLMGTDKLGRDVFSRVVYGARISLAIGFSAILIAVTLGTAVGAVSGYFGGALDSALMRGVDVLIAFPRLVLLIVVVSLFDQSIALVILVLGLTLWPSTARIVRGEVLSLREREFVQAARALGFGDLRIVVRHVAPNVLAPVIVAATLGIGNVILIEAGLSFLGFGVPIDVPTWGRILSDGRENMLSAWWVATFPGLAIVYTVVVFNLIGDGLRDALDPRLRI